MRILKIKITNRVVSVEPISEDQAVKDTVFSFFNSYEAVIPKTAISNINRDQTGVELIELRGQINKVEFSSIYSIQDRHREHIITDSMTHKEVFKLIKNNLE